LDCFHRQLTEHGKHSAEAVERLRDATFRRCTNEAVVWQMFARSREDGRDGDDALCLVCGRILKCTGGSTKGLLDHLSSAAIRATHDWALAIVQPVTRGGADKRPASDSGGAPVAKKLAQVTLGQLSSRMSAADMAEAHAFLVDWVASAMLPLSAARHPLFIRFIKRLRPEFNPPGHTAVRGILLDNERRFVSHVRLHAA
jgi:hypothetical protein